MEGRKVNSSHDGPPTPEEFERAAKIVREKMRNLDNVCEDVRAHFHAICPMQNIYIIDQRDVDFRAYIFMERRDDVVKMRSSGVYRQVIDFVYSSLERWGRGKRDEITVAFEFDSDERVEDECEGDYNLRLHAGAAPDTVYFYESSD